MPYDVALKGTVKMSAPQANSTSEEYNTSVDRKFAGIYELAPKGKVRSNTTESFSTGCENVREAVGRHGFKSLLSLHCLSILCSVST
jgi:hypothetical protein